MFDIPDNIPAPVDGEGIDYNEVLEVLDDDCLPFLVVLDEGVFIKFFDVTPWSPLRDEGLDRMDRVRPTVHGMVAVRSLAEGGLDAGL